MIHTLTYWCCICHNDSAAYNVRARTRREALEESEARGGDYSRPFKVVVQYLDALDLVQGVLGEGGGER